MHIYWIVTLGIVIGILGIYLYIQLTGSEINMPSLLPEDNVTESFDGTTNPQMGNVLAAGNLPKSSTIDSNYATNNMNNMVMLATLPQPFIIKQIILTGVISEGSKKIRIAIANTTTNNMEYAMLNQHSALSGSIDNITASTDTSGSYNADIISIYGGDIIGNKISIYSEGVFTASGGKYIIIGYPENDRIDFRTFNSSPGYDIIQGNKIARDNLYVMKKLILAPASGTNVSDGTKIKIRFRNPYSNNIFTYPGPSEYNFIYTKDYPSIYFTKSCLAVGSSVEIMPSNSNLVISDYYVKSPPDESDISRFKLEYNLTDLRGSINPDAVCPSVNGLISRQLDAELLVDSIDYIDQINTEKVKLASNKDNLLTLMEQESDIAKLGKMITKIRDLQKQRQMETDALNALRFTRQLNEVMQMREILEKRIARRKENTYDITFDVGVMDPNEAANKNIPDVGDVFKV